MSEKVKILLADDDPDFIEINKTILETKGYEVDEAYTSSEALNKIRATRYDLLILDLMMEEKDAGFTVAYAVREDENLKDLPILMLTSAQEKTGFTFKFSKDKEWMKVDDFAAKPLKPAELVERVEKLLK
ncbi:response regulator [candidate division KSB1 bacterium]|nr:response regulator [candidate division KSB1 bacterium]